MKTTVDSMETEISKLAGIMDTMFSKAEVIHNEMTENRQKIRELNGAHSMLKKVMYLPSYHLIISSFSAECDL